MTGALFAGWQADCWSDTATRSTFSGAMAARANGASWGCACVQDQARTPAAKGEPGLLGLLSLPVAFSAGAVGLELYAQFDGFSVFPLAIQLFKKWPAPAAAGASIKAIAQLRGHFGLFSFDPGRHFSLADMEAHADVIFILHCVSSRSRLGHSGKSPRHDLHGVRAIFAVLLDALHDELRKFD